MARKLNPKTEIKKLLDKTEVDEKLLIDRLISRGKDSGRADDQDRTKIQNRFDEYNTLTNPSNSQFWYEQLPTPVGYTSSYHSDQAEFYNGELPYSPLVVVNTNANPTNTQKFSPVYFNFSVITFNSPSSSFLTGGNPGSGTIALWFDGVEGTFNPPNTYLSPNYNPSKGSPNTANSTPTTTVAASLPAATDKGGSSGGGSVGPSTGGSGRTVPSSPISPRK